MFLKKGSTLIEAIIYAAILALVAVMATDSLLIMMKSYASIKITRAINLSAQTGMERMAREIRNANSVDDANSIFAVSPGRLRLNTVDLSGASTTIEFTVGSSTVFIKEGAAVAEALTPSSVQINNLTFNKITASNTSVAIKIKMGVTGVKKDITKLDNFYDTVILRGSY